MTMGWERRAALVLTVLALAGLSSGCAGVPGLYKPKQPLADRTKDMALAPKVDHILRQISCELSMVSKTQLRDRHYVINVTLTLQVDDEINLTPSLSFIEPLTVTGTSRTLTQGLGVGGSRQRKFTANFYYDSKKLQENHDFDAPSYGKRGINCGADEKKLYRLDGHLGLFEIARDGIRLRDSQPAATGSPGFASQVKFVVTRSVSAFGPGWTLISFKGPGGANGLLNGKALTTDSIDISFAPYKVPDPTMDRLVEELRALVAELRDRETAADAALASARRKLTDVEQMLQRDGFKAFTAPQRSLMLDGAQQAVSVAEAQQRQTSQDRLKAERRLVLASERAIEAAETMSQESAIRAGDALITRMILQNLSTAPR